MDENTELDWLILSHLSGCSAAFRRRLQLSNPDTPPRALLEAPEENWQRAGADRDLLAGRRELLRTGPRHRVRQKALADQETLRRYQHPEFSHHVTEPAPTGYRLHGA